MRGGILLFFFFLLIMVVGYVNLVVTDGKERGLDGHKRLSDRDILWER